MSLALSYRAVGKPRRAASAPPLVARTLDGKRVQLCLPAAMVLDLREHLADWADTTAGQPPLEPEADFRFELAVMCWAGEMLVARAALWIAPAYLNRVKLPLSQAVILYHTLRQEYPTSSLAPLRDRLHQILV